MGRPLPRVKPIQGLNGRMWDITKPIFQVCELVYPEASETVREALLEKAGERVEEKRETIEGDIVTAIYELSPKESSKDIPKWSIPIEKILNKINTKGPKGQKLTSQSLGKKVKALGLRTRKIHGYSQIVLNREDLSTLLVQFGLPSPTRPPETLPHSTNPNNETISNGSMGRESMESQGNLNDSLPSKVLENQTVGRPVESGRESCGDDPSSNPSPVGPVILNENLPLLPSCGPMMPANVSDGDQILKTAEELLREKIEEEPMNILRETNRHE